MRKRSNTIHADTYEEFYDISISQNPNNLANCSTFIESPYCYFSSDSQLLEDPLLDSDMLEQDFSDLHKPFKPMNFSPESKSNTKGHLLNTPSTEAESASFEMRTDSFFSCSESPMDKFCKFGAEGKVISQGEEVTKGKLYKVMVIGGIGTGRHSMINTLFKDQKEENRDEPKLRNSLDLLIRSKKENKQENRYKFWIRDPSCQRFDPLIKVYYKSIDYYVFLYKTSDKASLECAERAIQEVLDEVPNRRFKGLLVGNSLDGREERKVSWEEGESLRTKYRLERFIEVGDLKNDLQKLERGFQELLGANLGN